MEQHVLNILDRSGHRSLAWSPALEAELAGARDEFSRMKSAGYMAYAPDGSGGGSVVKDFDPSQKEIVMTPPLVGG